MNYQSTFLGDESTSSRISFPVGNASVAFSLVEVVLSIGIVSFAVLAILGILSVGMNSNRDSKDDTILALATQEIEAWVRSQSFQSLAAVAGEEPYTNLFMTSGGLLEKSGSGAPINAASSGSHYSCTISVFPTDLSSNFLQLQYLFEWPLEAPATARRKRVMVSSRTNEN